MKLTFFFPYYGVSGVPVLFSRLAPHLARHHGADVEVVDYPDGYMAQSLGRSSDVRVVPFARGTPLPIDGDRLLIMQSILPATIAPELAPDTRTRVLFWTLHPMNFVQTIVPTPRGRDFQARHAWVSRAASRTVLRRFAAELSTFVSGLLERNSLVFVDGSTLEATRENLGLEIPSPTFVPTPCPVDSHNPSRNADMHSPMTAAWVGRLDDFKTPMLVHTLRALSAYAAKRSREIRFTIVGDGPMRASIHPARFEHEWFRVVETGTLDAVSLDRFLASEVDVLFAMGTSALEGAKLGVPTVLLDIAYGRVPDGYVFRWLHDSTDFGLGAMIRLRPIVPGNESLQRMIDAVIADRAGVSIAAHQYCLDHHGLEAVGRRFIAAAGRATFRYGDMSDRLKRKGFLRRGYEWMRLWRTGERYPTGRAVRRADSR
jgi:glycosyltransferase involved in cell wall biosynthesis